MLSTELEHLGHLKKGIKDNPKEVWKYVKSKQAVKETIPDIIDVNFSADLKDTAENFYFYFQFVFAQTVLLSINHPELVNI